MYLTGASKQEAPFLLLSERVCDVFPVNGRIEGELLVSCMQRGKPCCGVRGNRKFRPKFSDMASVYNFEAVFLRTLLNVLTF